MAPLHTESDALIVGDISSLPETESTDMIVQYFGHFNTRVFTPNSLQCRLNA